MKRKRLTTFFVTLAAFALPVTAQDRPGFSLGVAVGDVTGTSAVFWTRADDPGEIILEASLDEEFATVFVTAAQTATLETDLTIHLDLAGLVPGTEYFYRFARADDPGRTSRTGRFRTPHPENATGARFIFSGDTNFAHAPFSVAGDAAAEDADAFIWFGDTIYGDVPVAGLGPAFTLADYRAKYRQVRSDPHVRELLARMSVIAGWDDHEVRNDYAGLDPALSRAQRDAGYRAFFEYMPVRRQNIAADPFRTYRRLTFGAAELFLLDARQYRETSARAECGGNLDPEGFGLGVLTADRACVDAIRADRQMLGPAQFEWLTAGLAESAAPVKLVVNNVPLTHMGVFPYDRWDGYDAQRRGLLEFIDAGGIDGVLVLTTDIHANGFNPDVGGYFRWFRRDYRLAGTAAVPEIVVGPLGNATARQSVAGILGELTEGAGEGGPASPFGSVLDSIESAYEHRLLMANGLDFIELNRVSYALIDVSPAGEVHVNWRGRRPEDVNDPEAASETFFETQIDWEPGRQPPFACGCGGPAVLLTGMVCLAVPRRRGLRGRRFDF